MNDRNSRENHKSRRVTFAVSAAALAAAFVVGPAAPARAERVTPPRVPGNLEVKDGSRAFLQGHAFGTQNYICLPAGSAFAWTLFTPQATLFDDDGRQIITHFFSPNPSEPGTTIRAAWQHSRDTSVVWAALFQQSSDTAFVAQGAIPWLLLQQFGTQDGPDGGTKLSKTSWVQRVNTSGGIMPSTGCAQASDVGTKRFVPYTADYFFYKHPDHDE